MKSTSANSRSARRIFSLALFFIAFCFVALLFSANPSPQATAPAALPEQAPADEPADVAAFRQSAGGSIAPLIIELKDEPGVLRKVAAEKAGKTMSMEQTISHAQGLLGKQDAFLASLPQRGVRALLRRTNVKQVDGTMRHIQYRFTYLLNGFVAFVADEDVARLRALPEVAHVSEPEQMSFNLDRAIDYSLGTQASPAARRTAVYGATKEFEPAGAPGHPEAPSTTTIDGFEGQGMNIAVIDSGVDYRHPMFGGIGQTTAFPRVSGQAASPNDNRKVIYFFAFSQPVGDPTDDFGHGTLVSSCLAGYSVDGDTPPILGFGLGRDGTGIGPTPNGAQLFGTAPQARIMAYKVCGPANACSGDIELSIEDAASPVTLTGTGNGGSIPTMVSKPVADVINLSLGDTGGDPAGPSARACNNAALAGTIVVASAGNAGPGPGTIGAPSAATLALSVAASLDPGSIAAADVLAPNQVPADLRVDNTPGPPAEEGETSNLNAIQPGERQGIKIFPVAGGGPLPVEENPGDPALNTGSLSAHYVRVNDPNTTPPEVRNRIALVLGGTGTFFNIVNAVAAQSPAAIIITDDRESLTAVVVAGSIPVFNVNEETAAYLINRISNTDADGPDDDTIDDAPVGAISQFPLRLADSFTLENFTPAMAGFSSRGPNDHENARFRVIKPDVSGPGVGIVGAATPEGLPDDTVGLASLTGYTTANGTSFSGPITAGAITLVRQRVREQLNLDSTDPEDIAQRFDAVIVARALLQNSATNLRSGLGVPQGDGAASVASINDMGSGHINIAGALANNAIMVSPTDLLFDPEGSREFTPEEEDPPVSTLEVLLPTSSFGPVPVIGVNGTIVRTREVIIRDVFNGAGGSGVFNLTVQNNRPNPANPGFAISFTSADGTTPITSVSVPANGQASFRVRVAADGAQILEDPTEFQWYVTATGPGGQSLRMPFYYRAVRATIPNITAPEQQEIEGLDEPSPTPSPSPSASPAPPTCPADSDGSYTINYTYTQPEGGGPNPAGFRVQEGTRSNSLFFDNANQLLVAGANDFFSGSPQWTTNVNPATGSPAYFIPDAAEQNESLTMVDTVDLPPGGATLSFDTTQDTEQDFDFANVDISTNGVDFMTLASFSGVFEGTRSIDISAFAGQEIKVRFRLTSDMNVSAPGWFVENIRVSSDDFRTVGNTGAAATSLGISGRFDGTYFYRVAGIFNNPIAGDPTVTGPYSNVRCVSVIGNSLPPPNRGALQFSAATYALGEDGGSATIQVTRSVGTAGTVRVDFATSNGSASGGSDFANTSGTLTFGPGVASQQFTVPINDDGTPEGDETVNLTLTNPSGGAILGAPATATLTIIDDDTPSITPGTLQFSAANYSAAETGGATITVTRTGGRSGVISISYATSDGTANANSDYTPASGMLSFAEGETTKTFGVPLIDDPSPEPDETVLLTLSSPTGGATLGSPAKATLTILDTDRSGPPAQLLNISSRLRVQTGDNVGIGGLIITGTDLKQVGFRAIGPSLNVRGTPVPDRLQDPELELFDGNGAFIVGNDDWRDTQEAAIQESGLAPTDDRESVILRTLSPGEYTAIIRGKDGGTGVGLVEAYDLDRSGDSVLANISTRGFVETGDNVLIGGFIAGRQTGATNVVVRAIGPSLAGEGVPQPLQDPTVELFNRNGDMVNANDDFASSPQQAEIESLGLAPEDSRESALLQTVAPGEYTAIVRGKGDSPTGVALVEVYNIP